MPVEIVNKLATDGENSVELRLIIQNAAVLKGKRIIKLIFVLCSFMLILANSLSFKKSIPEILFPFSTAAF